MTGVTAETVRVDIFIAGELADAKRVCRQFCFEIGFCVTVEPVAFVYTGGEESGVRVGLLNYPRFPSTAEEIERKALALAERLRAALCQHSYSVVGPKTTTWVSARY